MLDSGSKDDTLVKKCISEYVKEISDQKDDIKKIAIFTSVFSKFEGASRVAETQSIELSEQNYSVTVFTFMSDIVPETFSIEIIRSFLPLSTPFLSKLYHAFFPFNIIQILQLMLIINKFDLIILHHGTFTNLGYLTKIFYGTKIIYFNHHVEGDVSKEENSLMDSIEEIYNKFVWSIYWRLIRNFDYVISVSKYSRKKLFESKGIDSVVIYNKIDSIRFTKGLDGRFIREKHHINDDNSLILYVGRILPHKGIHLLIEAFDVVKMKNPNIELLVAGKHYNNEYSQKLLQMSNESIHFAGRISDEELPYYYAACDVYATCSLLEGFNLPLVEAQACGKRVVAFNIGPHKEVVNNGYLVKENDVEEFGRMLIKVLAEGERNSI